MAISTETTQRWPIPAGLSGEGQVAAGLILQLLEDKQATYHGGGGRFYSPEEWADRGEEYGLNSLLIITHDGGDHAPVFNLDYGAYDLNEELSQVLKGHGMFVEACTSWYSAVYPI